MVHLFLLGQNIFSIRNDSIVHVPHYILGVWHLLSIAFQGDHKARKYWFLEEIIKAKDRDFC